MDIEIVHGPGSSAARVSLENGEVLTSEAGAMISMSGDMDTSFSYSFGDLGELTFPEEDMRKKYPALKQAWEHYQSVLEVCKTKEQEDED